MLLDVELDSLLEVGLHLCGLAEHFLEMPDQRACELLLHAELWSQQLVRFAGLGRGPLLILQVRLYLVNKGLDRAVGLGALLDDGVYRLCDPVCLRGQTLSCVHVRVFFDLVVVADELVKLATNHVDSGHEVFHAQVGGGIRSGRKERLLLGRPGGRVLRSYLIYMKEVLRS